MPSSDAAVSQALGFTLTACCWCDGRPGGQPAAGKVFQHTTVLNVVTSPCAAARDSLQSLAGRAEAADPGRRARCTFCLCGERRLTWKRLVSIQQPLLLCKEGTGNLQAVVWPGRGNRKLWAHSRCSLSALFLPVLTAWKPGHLSPTCRPWHPVLLTLRELF